MLGYLKVDSLEYCLEHLKAEMLAGMLQELLLLAELKERLSAVMLD